MKPQNHKRSTQHQFDRFCKLVLRNELRDYYRELDRERKRQTQLSALTFKKEQELFYVDEYPSEYFMFSILGYKVILHNEKLAEAIKTLPQDRQDIILLYYFVGMNDRESGILLNLKTATVGYNRNRALEQIKKQMEVLKNE